jgi:hypothetical protein
VPNYGVEFENNIHKPEFYICTPEKHSGGFEKIDLFKEYADIDDILLSIIERDIKSIIEEYNPGLNYCIDYDIDPEEPIPYLVIKLTNRLSVDEEINFSKYIWKSMRKRGHKDFLRKASIVVDYD